jgi:hypothetical protein
MRKGPEGSALYSLDERINRIFAMAKATVEDLLRAIKQQFGCVRTCNHGLANNRVHLFLLFALGFCFGTTEASGPRTSLPDNRQTSPAAGLHGRNPAKSRLTKC